MARTTYDACVVGSGHGGGVAAMVLAKAGLRVALVEAGPRLRAGVDYGKHSDPYDVLESRLKAGIRSPMESLFRDRGERDHFVPVGDRPNHGLLKALGGRSLCWAGHTLRFGPGDYKRWPISYEEVAPYYSKAERMMGIYGHKDGLWNMPDGEYMGTVPMRCNERKLHAGVQRLKAKGLKMEFVPLRKAMLLGKHESGRSACHFCGKCGNCCVDAKYTAANTAIPAALKTGKLTVLTGCTMTHIGMSADKRRVESVEFRKTDGSTDGLNCKALVMACSSIETARQLLINNVANSSGQVGKNLTSHFGITVLGFYEDLARRAAPYDEGTGYYHSLLTGMYWDKPHPEFDGTYQVQCGAAYTPSNWMVRDLLGYGAAFKRKLIEHNLGHAGMNMQATLLQTPKKFIDLDPVRKDRNGMPLPRVHLHYEQNDIRMAQDCLEKCVAIIEAGGGKVISRPDTIRPDNLVIDYNHWVGTARMGKDPKASVVNTWGQSHDVKNLFVADAAVFPWYPEKNPVLTIAALSWRMSEHLAAEAKKGAL